MSDPTIQRLDDPAATADPATTPDPAPATTPDAPQPGDAQEPGTVDQPDKPAEDTPPAATDAEGQDAFTAQDEIDVPLTGGNLEDPTVGARDRGRLATAGQATASADALQAVDEERGVVRDANIWDDRAVPSDPGAYAHERDLQDEAAIVSQDG